MTRFARFVQAFLVWNFAVIGWGAFVRASGSGAGCGDHWPLCNGQVVPHSPTFETIVEFGHRLTSGLAGIGAIVLVVWAYRAFAKGHPARRGAWWTLAFMIAEGLVGAGLVKFGYVADDPRLERGFVMAAHLINTFVLLYFIALTGFWAEGGGRLRWGTGGLPAKLGIATLLGILVVGMSGAIAALGDTLFPANSLAEGFAQDLSPQSHLFLRLRALHPLGAVVFAIVAGAASILTWMSDVPAKAKRAGIAVGVLVLVQVTVGLANLALLAPIPLQLLHLLVADALWVAAVLMTAHLVGEPAPAPEAEAAAVALAA